MKKIIGKSDIFPLSRAILSDSKYTLEISGQIGNEDGKLVDGIKEQTAKSLENIKTILAEVGWTFDNLTKVRIFLSDMKHYEEMNKVYAKYFEKEYPARAALAVRELPSGALVEIECTAAGDEYRV